MSFLNVASLPKRSRCLQEKKKKRNYFGFVICIITVSDFPMYVLFYCDIRCIFQNFKLKSPKREASSFWFELCFMSVSKSWCFLLTNPLTSVYCFCKSWCCPSTSLYFFTEITGLVFQSSSFLFRFKALLSSKPSSDSTCIEINYVKYPIFQVKSVLTLNLNGTCNRNVIHARSKLVRMYLINT